MKTPEMELTIQTSKGIIFPEIVGEITWETIRSISAGVLKFTCYRDEKLTIEEGNPVSLKADGKGVFFGFLFTYSADESETVDCTAYDQVRYLKAKDTYVYENKTADQVITMIATDFGLQVGELASTGYTIKSRIEDNQTLADIIQNALDETMILTNEMYVFFDDFGKLTLKKVEDMRTDVLITNDTAQGYSSKFSIDGEVYNKIKLHHDDKEKGKREIYVAEDGGNIGKWGILQKADSVSDGVDGQTQANMMLELYNRPLHSLSIKDAFGSLEVRGGSLVFVELDDLGLTAMMMVESCKHRFSKGLHTMDLDLRGAGFE